MAETITVTNPKSNRTVEFEKDFGASLEEAVQIFGEAAVYSAFVAQAVIRTQAVVRAQLGKEDVSDDDAIQYGLEYKLGERRPAATRAKAYDKVALALANGTMTMAQLQAYVEQKRAELAAQATEDAA